MVGLYRVSLLMAVTALAGAVALVAVNVASLSPGMGNGGSFLVALSLGAVLMALTVATPLAWLAAGVSFIWQEVMPEGRLYHYSVPVALALPGTLLLLVAAWSSI